MPSLPFYDKYVISIRSHIHLKLNTINQIMISYITYTFNTNKNCIPSLTHASFLEISSCSNSSDHMQLTDMKYPCSLP